MPASEPVTSPPEEIAYRLAWRRGDPTLRRQALAFWEQTGRLPPGVEAEKRADELCVLGYVDGRLQAVTSAVVRPVPFLGGLKFAMYRVLVSHAFRRHGISRAISGEVRRVLSEWSRAHPEEAVMGFGAVVQSTELKTAPMNAATRMPSLRLTGLTAVNYTETGDLIRLTWFEHARV